MTHACTRHRGDKERAFIERFLRRNRGTFPEGGTLQKRNSSRQGCAKEPQWFGNAGGKCPWWLTGKGMRMREGCGAGELFPCQTST